MLLSDCKEPPPAKLHNLPCSRNILLGRWLPCWDQDRPEGQLPQEKGFPKPVMSNLHKVN